MDSAGAAGDDPRIQHNPTTELRPLLGSLLESGEFRAAVARYEAIYDTRPLSASEPYRQSLVTHAGNLLLAGEAAAGVDLLEAYLDIFYRDPDALVTLGRAYRSLGDYPASIRAFQRARQYSHLSTMRDLIGDQLNWVVSQYRYHLRDEGRVDEIADIYIGLMTVEPDNPYYALGLAKAYAESARYDNAVRALSPVLHDAFVG